MKEAFYLVELCWSLWHAVLNSQYCSALIYMWIYSFWNSKFVFLETVRLLLSFHHNKRKPLIRVLALLYMPWSKKCTDAENSQNIHFPICSQHALKNRCFWNTSVSRKSKVTCEIQTSSKSFERGTLVTKFIKHKQNNSENSTVCWEMLMQI